MMEGQIKKKCSKKNIAEIIVVLILIVVVGYFVFYRPLLKYINTHTWATIQVYGTASAETLECGAMNGAILENYVVAEIMKTYLNSGKEAYMYYYRDKDTKEIDIVLEHDGVLNPIEIK